MIKNAENSFTQKDEEKHLNEWRDGKEYKKLREKRKNNPGFYLCFGPPYPSGRLHLGTGTNGVWKDLVSRYKLMQGFDVEARPGWDMHGLPIEQKVEQAFKIDKTQLQQFGVKRFIEECKKFSEGNKQVMTEDFKNLGCLVFDWDNPYKTLSPEYMFGAWFVVKKAQEKGLLYKGKYPVIVCPRCQTSLSKAEGVHKKKLDNTVYVLFKLKGKDEHLMIWTTTPWTLPSNQGVMAHPEYSYALVSVNGKKAWVAKERIPALEKKFKTQLEILGETTGAEMGGWKYEPALKGFTPLQAENEKAFRVILSKQFVNLDDGTGLVHTAPGHGREDYSAGKEAGLPIVNPVGLDGRYGKESGPRLEGKSVFDANKDITAYLKESGSLVKEEPIEHDYPHCWRCSTPLLQLGTDNWFIKSTAYKEKILEENSKVNYVPDYAQKKAEEWFTNIDDWCISRQRYWGIPLPLWDCNKCGKTTIIGSLKELQEKSVNPIPDDFDPHIPAIDDVKIKCECGQLVSRIADIMDVWLESSVASWSALDYPTRNDKFEKFWPADLNIEGRDQVRGWWNSQMNASVVVFNEAPFKSILINSWVLDESGVKMSKSLGNVVSPNELIEKCGRDATRMYFASTPPDADSSFSPENLQHLKRTLDVLWNSYKFATTYMALDAYNPLVGAIEETQVEDKWILSRLNTLTRQCTENFDEYKFQKNVALLQEFILNDLSRWYVKLIRNRVWLEGRDMSKLAAYRTLHAVLERLSRIMAPLAPFMSDEIYRNLVHNLNSNEPDSVHFTDWPETQEQLIDADLERAMEVAKEVVEAGLAARNKAKVKLRWPVQEAVVFTDDLFVNRSVDMLKQTIASQLNCKEVKVASLEESSSSQLSFSEMAKAKVGVSPEVSGELYAEAMSREVIRRVQQMRKEMNLKENAAIVAEVCAPKKFLEMVAPHKDSMAKETRAELLLAEKGMLEGYQKSENIEDSLVVITVSEKKAKRETL